MVSIAGFDWDVGNRKKCEKHGVSTATIESVFDGEVAVHPDPAHSQREERLKAIGQAKNGRTVLVVFTLRERGGGTFIRPISARYMHRKEVEYYEKETTEAEKR
jgi:uncharacterized protein